MLDALRVEHVFPASGVVARVQATNLDRDPVAGFRLRSQEFGEVSGLPAPKEGTVYIVSALVLGQCKDRSDVVAPDTGPDAVRENGQIRAVRGFVQ